MRDKILAKGGQYVAVFNLPDSSLTNFGGTGSVDTRGVLTTLVDTFNLWLRDGLGGQPVQLVGQNTAGKAVDANPVQFGLTVNTVPTCDATGIGVPAGADAKVGNATTELLSCESAK